MLNNHHPQHSSSPKYRPPATTFLAPPPETSSHDYNPSRPDGPDYTTTTSLGESLFSGGKNPHSSQPHNICPFVLFYTFLFVTGTGGGPSSPGHSHNLKNNAPMNIGLDVYPMGHGHSLSKSDRNRDGNSVLLHLNLMSKEPGSDGGFGGGSSGGQLQFGPFSYNMGRGSSNQRGGGASSSGTGSGVYPIQNDRMYMPGAEEGPIIGKYLVTPTASLTISKHQNP